MGRTDKLPIGIESFKQIRTEGFYYVDKTDLITELLNSWSKVNLFTRPRRFGKSLNMSMLKAFFEYGCDSRLFDGLKIAGEKELCEKYMGQFPVISISMKDVNAANFETARQMLCSVIGREALRFQFLLESDKLSGFEKSLFQRLLQVDREEKAEFVMEDDVLVNSLLTLSDFLYKYYGKEVILLIDEYDVPLDKAQHFGFYDDMLNIIRMLFSRVLKSNDNLYFAVLTGCMRISKESVFTGLNNFNVLSITNIQYDEHFGFSDKEVREILAFYQIKDKYDLVKEWYDGYRFGNADVYCPWDVINYVNLLRSEPDAEPEAFWANTSGNDILRKFLQIAKPRTKRELEKLIEGESIAKKINKELVYRDLYENTDNIWSVLFTTGYLTQRGKVDRDMYRLVIPNLEIRKIFIDQIMQWFQESARKDTPMLDAFCESFMRSDAEMIEKQFNEYLQKTISIRDTNVRKEKKENFYHGILLGLLSHREDWDVDSNAESGEGFSDILIEIEKEKIGIVIEVKYPDSGNLEAGCKEALDQITKKHYETKLQQDGMEKILKYGIACRKKECRVEMLS